jgi:hypothetical protein
VRSCLVDFLQHPVWRLRAITLPVPTLQLKTKPTSIGREGNAQQSRSQQFRTRPLFLGAQGPTQNLIGTVLANCTVTGQHTNNCSHALPVRFVIKQRSDWMNRYKDSSKLHLDPVVNGRDQIKDHEDEMEGYEGLVEASRRQSIVRTEDCTHQTFDCSHILPRRSSDRDESRGTGRPQRPPSQCPGKVCCVVALAINIAGAVFVPQQVSKITYSKAPRDDSPVHVYYHTLPFMVASTRPIKYGLGEVALNTTSDQVNQLVDVLQNHPNNRLTDFK